MTPPPRGAASRTDPVVRDAGRLLRDLDAARARRRRPAEPPGHAASATADVVPGTVPRRRPR
ncbi:hypothetical protein [Pseudokineococcus lusitanus]|jgi:hypothetical protein|uniref:Uncharacterized protein n=1 Tax=Pseudokineococcus lusitanus TaxID=763993 RepID=A0A3N1GXG1_9ACTN|nr:hypothetical protein [Pseudokineococcus lusitanus]ROP34796.1 hypothetical protein EDC03_2618 [Pseudokineococcus lusitanus]